MNAQEIKTIFAKGIPIDPALVRVRKTAKKPEKSRRGGSLAVGKVRYRVTVDKASFQDYQLPTFIRYFDLFFWMVIRGGHGTNEYTVDVKE